MHHPVAAALKQMMLLLSQTRMLNFAIQKLDYSPCLAVRLADPMTSIHSKRMTKARTCSTLEISVSCAVYANYRTRAFALLKWKAEQKAFITPQPQPEFIVRPFVGSTPILPP